MAKRKNRWGVSCEFTAIPVFLFLLGWYLLLPWAAPAQTGQDSSANVADSIARLKSGDFSLAAVEQIAEAHAVQAIPALKEQFALSKDTTVKGKIAAALVRLGDKDDTYWNYLIELATVAVKSDAPFPTMFDANGKVVPGQVPPEFAAWTKSHNVSLGSATETVAYILPGNVAILGETADPRAIPLLRQALQSPNFMIAAMAAKGLAQSQDKESIPLIVEACRRAPSDAVMAIADSLIYFDDPKAQNAADTYLPKQYADSMREAKAQGKGPFHY